MQARTLAARKASVNSQARFLRVMAVAPVYTGRQLTNTWQDMAKKPIETDSVNDPFASRVIAATAGEAPYVLDGLLYHQTGLTIEEHYTDTGGASDHVFGLMPFFGYRFAPRLRDIKELFMDTGIGNDAYCIIEQGKVDAMLRAQPIERRSIIEEAAGVARFRARKHEAARKLDHAERHLVAVREQLSGVERRLRIVRGQAEKARKFQALEAQRRTLRTALAALLPPAQAARWRSVWLTPARTPRPAASPRWRPRGAPVRPTPGSARGGRCSAICWRPPGKCRKARPRPAGQRLSSPATGATISGWAT